MKGGGGQRIVQTFPQIHMFWKQETSLIASQNLCELGITVSGHMKEAPLTTSVRNAMATKNSETHNSHMSTADGMMIGGQGRERPAAKLTDSL